MRLSRIQVENYCNFKLIDIELGGQVVVVGENKVGKSNLLCALRLVLDPSLPESARQLRMTDFWDGLPKPLTREDVIKVSVDLTDFEDKVAQLALLAEHLVCPDPMTARLTYVFQPLATLTADPTKESDYEWFVYGGDRTENRVGYEVRQRLPLDVLEALRDSEADLANWKRSPLRPLLVTTSSKIERAKLIEIADEMTAITERATSLPEVEELASSITTRLVEMVGSAQALETALGFSPTDPDRLLKTLRLFIDGTSRDISDASVGSANLLYLALKSLQLEQLVKDNSREHTFLAIEEPEAHLHPHLQRLVYRDALRPSKAAAGTSNANADGADYKSSRTILLTTHSPHIVSVAPLRSLVFLRRSLADGTTAVAAATLKLSDREIADLERYIDVTRGECLFARAVLLVEGDAEAYLVPILAKNLGYDFDELGITLCSISGTNFAPYVKLFGPTGLNIPLAVATDLDPLADGTNLGHSRVIRLLKLIAPKGKVVGKNNDALLKLAPDFGLFLNSHTFEIDLFECGYRISIPRTLVELTGNRMAKGRAEAWRKNPASLDKRSYLRDIDSIGKGRFAQRLSTRVKVKLCPKYLKDAFEYLHNKLDG